MATTNKVKGWTGVLMTEDSSAHWPIKRRHVYSETSRRVGLEFVCIFGHDAIETARRASLEFVCVFGHDGLDEHLELFRCYYNFVRSHGALKFGRAIRTPAMQAGLTARRLTFRDIFLATTIPLWSRIEVSLLSWARNPLSSAPVPLPAAA